MIRLSGFAEARHPHRVHRPAAGREALRGAARRRREDAGDAASQAAHRARSRATGRRFPRRAGCLAGAARRRRQRRRCGARLQAWIPNTSRSAASSPLKPVGALPAAGGAPPDRSRRRFSARASRQSRDAPPHRAAPRRATAGRTPAKALAAGRRDSRRAGRARWPPSAKKARRRRGERAQCGLAAEAIHQPDGRLEAVSPVAGCW